MASSSTNKQPLFIDRVLHYVVNLDKSSNNGIDPAGSNTATLIVDAVNSDGAIIEDIYVIARPADSQSPGTAATEHTVNLYMGTARDYLRPNESQFVGSITSGTTTGTVTNWEGMPRTLAPVPQVGDYAYNRAFYLPKGFALWAARDSDQNVDNGPLLGCQGGWY